MSFQPFTDTGRQCAERNERGIERDCIGVKTEKRKGKKKKKREKLFFFFANTMVHTTISIKWDCAQELSLRPFSGEGIQPEPFTLTGKEQHVILHLIATVSS